MKRLQWAAVILCAAAIAVNYLDRSTIAVANPEIRKEFALSAKEFGALQSAWSFSYALAQIPIGFFIDRLGAGILLGVSLILWSIAVAAGGFATNYTQLFIARTLLGITESPAYPTAVRVTSDWFRLQDRGLPTGVFNMGANIGTAVAPPFLTALMLLFGWRVMFMIMGGIGIASAVLWFILYREPEKSPLKEEDLDYLAGNRAGRNVKKMSAVQWSRLFKFRTTWGMTLGAFCSGYGIWMYVTWLPGYLEGQHHVSIAKTGYLASIPLMFTILGSFCGGYASDWLARSGVPIVQARKLPASLGYVGSGVFTALAAGSAGPGIAIVWMSLALFCLYFAVTSKWTLITAVSPQNYVSSCSSIQNFGSYIGGTVSPFLTGYVVDQTGSFVLALVIGSVIMLGAALFYYFMVVRAITEADLEKGSLSIPTPDAK
jgi:MFS family permease